MRTCFPKTRRRVARAQSVSAELWGVVFHSRVQQIRPSTPPPPHTHPPPPQSTLWVWFQTLFITMRRFQSVSVRLFESQTNVWQKMFLRTRIQRLHTSARLSQLKTKTWRRRPDDENTLLESNWVLLLTQLWGTVWCRLTSHVLTFLKKQSIDYQ